MPDAHADPSVVVTMKPMKVVDLAEVIACEDVYPVSYVARHYRMTTKTVRRIWASEVEVEEVEPPNIIVTKPRAEYLAEDFRILYDRGLNLREIAEVYGMVPETVRRVLVETGCRIRGTGDARLLARQRREYQC